MKSITSCGAAWPARRGTSLSLILFVAMVGAIGAPANAAEPAPSPASLQVSIDPRVELFAIIYRLAGYLYHGEDHAASHYETEVQEHFGRYREHPVVALATRLKEDRNVDYGVQLSLAVHVDDVANLQLRVPLDPWPETLHERWTPVLIDEFLAQARDFATQSDFARFVEKQGPFYAETVARAERALEAGVHVDWFDSFFGSQAGREFRVFISPLGGLHGWYAFWLSTEQGLEAMSVIGCRRLDDQGKPVFPQGARGLSFASGIVHELSHSYVNPTSDLYLDQLEEPVNRMKPFLVGYFARAYGQMHHSALVRESLVRAAVIRYLHERRGFLAGRRVLSKELKRGAFWMPELLETLEQYETQRDRYPGFQSYMPEVVEFFEVYSLRIRAKAAVARASLPLYVLLLVVYPIAVWLPSRRWPTPMPRTGWDRVVTFGLLYAVMGPAFEFFALGNRPRLPSLIAGAVLLLVATLIGRRARSEAGGTAPSGPPDETAGSWPARPRYVPDSLELSYLLVLVGAPVMLSARLSWVFSVIAVVAMLLQARASKAPAMASGAVVEGR
ncbi:MAG: DUF4932 domain-containing protein [Planctomycetota bacterium]